MLIVPNICMLLLNEKMAPKLAMLLLKVLIPVKMTLDEFRAKIAPNWPRIPAKFESEILIALDWLAMALQPSPDLFPMIEALLREAS